MVDLNTGDDAGEWSALWSVSRRAAVLHVGCWAGFRVAWDMLKQFPAGYLCCMWGFPGERFVAEL
ncbi:MAG: hypothetical protein JNM66_22980 [Bryobacterales bacterium]|nr:hypothetical protein [Bryobacterales bacterium]